ncbi:MAG: polysaccharide biosynthesis/export family protein [Bacteroidota bacterium]
MKLFKYSLLIGLSILLSNCSSQKDISYYQDIDAMASKNNESVNFETVIQPDDLLMIIVTSTDIEAAIPFNLESVLMPQINGQAGMGQRQMQMYLVDKAGTIEFPVLGTLSVGGQTKTNVLFSLKEKLKKYLKDPVINMRIMNFKVSVQGEVNRPGVVTSVTERLTLPEALSLAGDLTIYGKRNNIVVVRENQGKREIKRIDLTKADFINSPYYYLMQNDLIYVEPNSAKANSSTFNQNIPVWVSLSSVLISLVLLFKK